MNCPYCKSWMEAKTDWRIIISVITLCLLIGFIGGIFFFDWKMTPRFERKIEKDMEIKKELREGYLPPKPEKKIIK